MAGTRSSTRQNNDSSPSNKSDSAGTKRKAEDTSPSSAKKRGRPSKAAKEQKTIEETVPEATGEETKAVHENGTNHLTEMEDVEPERNEGESGAGDFCPAEQVLTHCSYERRGHQGGRRVVQGGERGWRVQGGPREGAQGLSWWSWYERARAGQG